MIAALEAIDRLDGWISRATVWLPAEGISPPVRRRNPSRWTDAKRERYPRFMEIRADIIALWPRWMDSAAEMLRMNALVRSRCAKCGTLLRVELADIVARHGGGFSLVDRLERCRMVGCAGSTFYLASRTYGRAWTMLLRDPTLIARFEALPPARTALG